MKFAGLPSLSLLAGLAAMASCRALPEPVCTSQLLVPVVRAVGPRRAALNQPVSYALDVKLGNNCGAFDSIVVSAGDNTTGPFTQQIGVRGRYTGCSCQADTTTVTPATYQFTPAKAGVYYLQFLTRQSRFITDTLVVQ